MVCLLACKTYSLKPRLDLPPPLRQRQLHQWTLLGLNLLNITAAIRRTGAPLSSGLGRQSHRTRDMADACGFLRHLRHNEAGNVAPSASLHDRQTKASAKSLGGRRLESKADLLQFVSQYARQLRWNCLTS